jgi:hypothetical protein
MQERIKDAGSLSTLARQIRASGPSADDIMFRYFSTPNQMPHFAHKRPRAGHRPAIGACLCSAQ